MSKGISHNRLWCLLPSSAVGRCYGQDPEESIPVLRMGNSLPQGDTFLFSLSSHTNSMEYVVTRDVTCSVFQQEKSERPVDSSDKLHAEETQARKQVKAVSLYHDLVGHTTRPCGDCMSPNSRRPQEANTRHQVVQKGFPTARQFQYNKVTVTCGLLVGGVCEGFIYFETFTL